MANWISSKLKAAETLLQQIDQQAAESLRKNEKSQLHEEQLETPAKAGGSLSLKDQLKKKTPETNGPIADVQRGSFESLPNRNNGIIRQASLKRDASKERTSASEPSPKQKSATLTDSDWTELLATPNRASSTLGGRSTNGVSPIRALKKDGKKKGNFAANFSGLASKSSQKSSNKVANPAESLNSSPLGRQMNGRQSDGEESSSSDMSFNSDVHNSKSSDGQGLERNTQQNPFIEPKYKDSEENYKSFDLRLPPVKEASEVENGDGMKAMDGLRNIGNKDSELVLQRPTAGDQKNKSLPLVVDGESSSDSESGSSTDSEREQEREETRRRREKILQDKMAAKAVEAIRDRENMIAKLEGEKQSLEKILDERAKQQAQEASELQMTMMETLEAVELEKQKHNNTRMELLARLARLETTNADLARLLAAAQKKLEVEVDQVAKLRQQIDLKQAAHGELRRRISGIRQSGKYLNELAASKGVEFQRQMMEEECSLIADKVGRLQDKAKKLEAEIEVLRKDMEEPTEVEMELKRRLDQLTDHLIKKQAQVEALTSEKATLMFRIEAALRLLEENKSFAGSSRDLESGDWDVSESKLRPMLEDKINSGKKHLGSIVQQLNAIFLYGAVFLRRNPTAKLWSVVYLVCLHFWVIYIFLSHSHSSTEIKSGAVVSLENINNTAGV